MAIDETVRSYQTKGTPVTNKADVPAGMGTSAPNSVSVQFNDSLRKELSHSDCPGCMY